MSIQQAYLYNIEKNSVILLVKVNKNLTLELQTFDNVDLHESFISLIHIVSSETYIYTSLIKS